MNLIARPGCRINAVEMTRSSFARVLAGRTLRFVGDSVTLDHYRYLARCNLRCNFTEVQPHAFVVTDKLVQEMRAAGHGRGHIHAATRHLAYDSPKESNATGCQLEGGGLVSFRRLNSFPHSMDAGTLAALMHMLLFLPNASALTQRDLVVMNVGLHRSESLPASISAMLHWWDERRKKGGAPRLSAPLGMYRGVDDVLSTHNQSCRRDESGDVSAALTLYDMNVSGAIANAGRWADVLRTFAASWQRAEDHPKLTSGALGGKFTTSAKSRAGLLDCTHLCATGSVLRFWSQALLAWLEAN
jgi:hypothetical protein